MNPDDFASLPRAVGSAAKEDPADIEAEGQLLCSCMVGGPAVFGKCAEAGVTGKSFSAPHHRVIFRALAALCADKSSTLEQAAVYIALKESGDLESVGLPRLSEVAGLVSTHAYATKLTARVREMEVRRTIAILGDSLSEHSRNGRSVDEIRADISGALPSLDLTTSKSLRSLCLAREFNHAAAPAEPTPRFLINDRPVCTPGNLTNIIAQSKSGKTAFTAAMMSAAIAAAFRTRDCDTLGITATAPGQSILLHIDTEQSVFDHDQILRTALRRAATETMPPWLKSFALAGFTPTALREAFLLLLSIFSPLGIHAVILDGAADLVNDVNDPAECNPFVAQLHGLAIEHNCPIISVVHENPGQDYGKMRGHFGSQLERKAESNLRLKKSDEATIVFSEKMRRAPILEKDGPRFSWDSKAKMHLSCQSAGSSRDDAKREKVRDIHEAVIAHVGRPKLRYAEILKGISEVAHVGASAAEDRFTQMKKLGVITKDLMGFWSSTP